MSKSSPKQKNPSPKEKPKRSPLPLYCAAAAWVLYALFFPLYRWWDFLLIAVLSAVIFFVLYFALPVRKAKQEAARAEKEAKQEQEQHEEPLSPMNEVERAIAECELYHAAVKKIKLRIFAINPDMSLEVVHLEKGLARIADHLVKYPDDAPKVRRFTEYYMPTALKHLETYLDVQGIQGQNAGMISSNVEGILHTLALSFEKLLDNLYADDALDISSDITVLEQLLRQEGLLEETMNQTKKGVDHHE